MALRSCWNLSGRLSHHNLHHTWGRRLSRRSGLKVGVVQQRVLERLHRHCLDPNLRLSVILHQLGHCWSGRCCLLCQRLDESELGGLAKQMMLSTRRDEVKHITLHGPGRTHSQRPYWSAT